MSARLNPQLSRKAGPRTLLLGCLALLFAVGCGRNFRIDRPDSSLLPARDILHLAWFKQLVEPEILTYKTQEWASASIDKTGNVFVGSSTGRFSAYSPKGKRLWTIKTNGAIASTPLVSETLGIVFFGANDGKMHAINLKTGTEIWSYATQGIFEHAPVEADGMLLFTTDENRVYAVDARSGKWHWQYDRPAPEGFTIRGYAGVLADRGVVYTGFSDGRIVALKASTGDVVWTRALVGEKKRFVDVDATPVLAGGLLITASFSMGVVAMDADNGSIRWSYKSEGASSVAASNGRIYFSVPTMGLVCLDQKGKLLWQQSIPRGIPSRPVLAWPYIYLTGTETGLYVASANTGELLQYFPAGRGISAPPAAVPGKVVILSNQGYLYAFGTAQ